MREWIGWRLTIVMSWLLANDVEGPICRLKTLREPIRELYHDLFPNQSNDSMFDASVSVDGSPSLRHPSHPVTYK
jgi:hypothetical protein